MTVRQALGELVQEGVLYREKGKGTFVCEPKVKQRDIMSFSEMVEKIGLKLKTEILTFEKVHTLENLKNLLPYDEVYKLDRLRIVEGEVIAKELVYIPLQYLEGVERKKLEYSLYNILEEKGIFIDHSEASIQAILIDDNYKKLFRIEKDVPLLKSFSKNITNNGKLIFIEESIYRSDKYILEVNMLRKEGKIK